MSLLYSCAFQAGFVGLQFFHLGIEVFYIMSSLRELRVATFIPDLLKTCSQKLIENSTNSFQNLSRACEQNGHTQSDEFNFSTKAASNPWVVGNCTITRMVDD